MSEETTDTTETQTSTTETPANETPAATATTEAGGGDAGATDSSDDADDVSIAGGATTEAGTGDEPGEGEKDGESEGGDDESGAEGADDGLPEKYELEMPEGVELDADLLDKATPVLKELGLGNEQAQKLVPIVTELQQRMAQRQADEFAGLRADWAKEAKADPEMGGANWKATEQHVARALDHFIGPMHVVGEDGKPVLGDDGKPMKEPFRALLDETGLGNHPTMLRAFRKIGEAMGEDGTFVRNGIGPEAPKSREEARYPNQVK